MAFFRKWKTHYKHKKFSSEDGVDGEEDWGLDRSDKDGQNLKFDFDAADKVGAGSGSVGDIPPTIPVQEKKRKRTILGNRQPKTSSKANDIITKKVIVSNAGSLDLNEDDGEMIDQPLFATYDLKYLGCTPIEKKRTEKVTAEAIKTVIANSRAGGRKAKSLLRVKLNISKDGVEVLDSQSQDTLMSFSIYKISYCSVDAAHDHAFTFVASETDPLTEEERMSCHVFQCPKRKIAHEITLMVARCFETAYQAWRDAVVMEQQHQEKQQKKQQQQLCENNVNHSTLPSQGNATFNATDNLSKSYSSSTTATATFSRPDGVSSKTPLPAKKEDSLIDLVTATSLEQRTLKDINEEESMHKYLQNTWVSFDDECGVGVQVAAC